ncbi:hypothetical protein PGIGA_G00176400 [Pangasianodon gigas]|uniref:Uncharacterized protein n=1 Tax=Pangasianodon gigas TaxID=30993 RepID=A0ACC5XW16_PANGG|nr:hypothetical protein [Pangasianodon gigas]
MFELLGKASANHKNSNMGKIEQKLTLFLIFIVLIGWTEGKENTTKYYSSYYGIPCDEDCDTHGKSYFWCYTKKGWDYCSTKENTDYKGEPCREDHLCGKYGKSYNWCYTKGDNWGYCGLLRNTEEPKTVLYKSVTYMSECWDECLYIEKKDYFRCHTDEGWDYCSPLPDVTYKNEPCRLDHYCGTHGSSHAWCFTNSGSDNCGLISPGECQYIIPTKEDSQTLISCIWNDEKNQKEIKFNAEPDLTISTKGSTWKNEIINFIARWKNAYLNPEPNSKPTTSENLRFEVQKLVNEDEQEYYNLQIMVNVYSQRGKSNKLAQVVILEHDKVPDRFVRLAFVESFRHQTKIFVQIN